MKIAFAENSYATQSLNNDAQELINYYPEHNPNSSKDRVTVYPTPGISVAWDLGESPVRALYFFANLLFAVVGPILYKIEATGITTNLGIIAGDGKLSIADNGFELCIVNGGQGYIYTVDSDVFETITDPNFYSSSSVVYQSRRFIFVRDGTNQFFISGPTTGLTYDALEFAPITTNAGNIKAILADHGEIWLFGDTYINVWVYTGNEAGFPFAEIQGANIEKGIAAIHTAVKLNNTLYWLAEDRQVYSATGYRPYLLSPPPISRTFQNYNVVEDAFAYSYSDKGHDFYVLTFPHENATWVFDASIADPSMAWHQRQTGTSGRHLANCYAKAWGKHYIGDYRTGKIYEYAENIYTDNGEKIHRVVTSPPMHGDRKRVFCDRVEIDIESGVGLTNGQGENPQAMLSYSDDGGQTWSDEKFGSMGKLGKYRSRLKYHNLGSFYQRIFKLKITDPVKTIILSADLIGEVEK
jgi:hypothetical protein